MPPNKLKSKIWTYFNKAGDKEAVCKICNKTLKTSGNTSNLRGHLENVHSQQLADEDVKSKKAKTGGSTIDNYMDVETIDIIASTSSASVEKSASSQISLGSTALTIAAVNSKKPKQPNVDDFIRNMKSIATQDGAKSKKITEAVVNFIIMDNKPFATVEGKGFLQLMKEVCPLYKVPSRETIKSRIDTKYEVMSNIFKSFINNAESYCITYDIWTETMQNKSFVGVTIHFLDKLKLLSGTLGVFELTESHTSAYIKEKLKEIFAEWHISVPKVSAVITDNDSTVMKVNREIFGEKKIIPCFAHTINLVVTKSIDNETDCTELISKVRNIIKFIKRSVNASDELRKRQVNMGLKEGQIKKMILDVRTRWNSCFYMLQRFIELVSIIGAILLNRPEAPPMILSSEIDCIKEMIEILSPFEKLTKEISGDSYVTVSKVIPLVSCVWEVIENMKPKNEMISQFKEEIKKQLGRRFDNIEHSAILSISTTLDPRFKFMHFKNSMAKGKVINCLNKYVREFNTSSSSTTSNNDTSDDVEDNSEFDIWKYHKQLTHKNMKNKSSSTALTDTISETEVQMYLSSPVTPIKSDAIEIWEDMKSLFPKLSKIAMLYLPIVATSVPSERLFSEAGATITQDRNRLLGTRLSKLLFLNSITKLLDCN
ncbi:E3 SUMO-protein ligase ZBED1-like [Lucilia cuprina]|uniref:E3 SUMO-protein ligase ZBED1-like n=1 Tax=Lucilia cuprina TaxID=7375 RepID=UPI001F06E659|nr:E3 SUMO-protein ligase ZBED1-like [Lucilia cuprina]